MKVRGKLVGTVVALGLFVFGSMALAEDKPADNKEAPKTVTITLSIFDANVRAFAPGIDAVISLTDAQRDKLAKIYNEVFGAADVVKAAKVRQNKDASVADRLDADATVGKAQAEFMKKSHEVFTPEQQDLIKKVYDAFNETYAAARKEMIQKVANDFSGKLDGILSSDQKASWQKAKDAIAAAIKKAEEEAAAKKKDETK